jgi:CubicO group peptidase (beta-lactamase class C family)
MKLDFMLNEYLDRTFEYNDLPGLAIGVKAGDLVYTGARGWADHPSRAPLTTRHVFHFASVSKLFVAAAVARLAEQNKIALDGSLLEQLPWFKPRDERCAHITVRQLVTHKAGLPDVKSYDWDRPETDAGALKRYLLSDGVSGMTLLSEPSDTAPFQYSNIGYEILGALIAEASEQTFEDFISEHFFVPAGMVDSTFLTFLRAPEGRRPGGERWTANLASADPRPNAADVLEARFPRLAMPHAKNAANDLARLNVYPYTRQHAPSSTLTSTLADITRWGDVFLSGENRGSTDSTGTRLLPHAVEDKFFGWFKDECRGSTLYGHEGTDDGFRSSFWLCPERDIQITVLSNVSKAPVKKINRQLFEQIVVKF